MSDLQDFPMADYVAELERQLRRAAVRENDRRRWFTSPTRGWRPRPTRIATAGIGLIAALALVLVLVLTISSGPGVSQALALPPAVNRPATNIAGLRGRLSATIGSTGHLNDARAITIPGGEGYLIPRPGGWCLAVPDSGSTDPDAEYGETCTNDATFRKEGLLAVMGRRTAAPILIAVLPAGSQTPTVQAPSGQEAPLTVQDGVAIESNLDQGAIVTFHDAANRTRTFMLPPNGPTRPNANTRHDCGNGHVISAARPCG